MSQIILLNFSVKICAFIESKRGSADTWLPSSGWSLPLRVQKKQYSRAKHIQTFRLHMFVNTALILLLTWLMFVVGSRIPLKRLRKASSDIKVTSGCPSPAAEGAVTHFHCWQQTPQSFHSIMLQCQMCTYPPYVTDSISTACWELSKEMHTVGAWHRRLKKKHLTNSDKTQPPTAAESNDVRQKHTPAFGFSYWYPNPHVSMWETEKQAHHVLWKWADNRPVFDAGAHVL